MARPLHFLLLGGKNHAQKKKLSKVKLYRRVRYECVQLWVLYYGVAKFPFFNACNKSFTVSLCVKGTSPGSDGIVFNRFSAVAGAHSLVTLSGGNWKDFQNYRWIVGEDIECPAMWSLHFTIHVRKTSQ